MIISSAAASLESSLPSSLRSPTVVVSSLDHHKRSSATFAYYMCILYLIRRLQSFSITILVPLLQLSCIRIHFVLCTSRQHVIKSLLRKTRVIRLLVQKRPKQSKCTVCRQETTWSPRRLCFPFGRCSLQKRLRDLRGNKGKTAGKEQMDPINLWDLDYQSYFSPIFQKYM